MHSFSLCNQQKEIILSERFLSNICRINPKSLWIQNRNFQFNGKSNFIDVLTQLPSQMNVTFGGGLWVKPIWLQFSNTVLKLVQNDRDDVMLLKAKSFSYMFNSDYFDSIAVMRNESEPDLEWLALGWEYYHKIEFEDFEPILNKEQFNKF